MTTEEKVPLIAALRAAAGRMFRNCRDCPDIHAYKDQIHYRYEAWSPKMTRRSYTGILSAELCVAHAERLGPPETARRMRRALAEREWDAFAPWMCTLVFGPALAHQLRRYESAVLLDLLDAEGCRDIGAGQLRIDRTLAALMSAKGVDVGALAQELLWADQSEDSGADHVDHQRDLVGTRCFATHDVVGAPIITSWEEFGGFRYDGIDFDLLEALPGVIASAAIGRPLADVVDTGDLDNEWRRIMSARTRDLQGAIPALIDFSWRTSFRLEPDLIEIARL